jgi:MoaA/NifB/PqqE/SkfB family radical SAM enzyme
MALPRYLQIEPVGQCNLRCVMCAIPFRQDGPPYGPPAFMPFDRFVSIVDQFPELEELHLQGLGEPMMHPRFFDMVRYGVRRAARVTTNTNGTLLTDSRACECVASGLECLHLSIDGATSESYERIRVRGHFDRLERNVTRLLRAKQEAGSATPRLRFVAVVMRQNLRELPLLAELAAAWGAEALSVQHLCHDLGESTLPDRYRPLRDVVDRETLLHEDPAAVEEAFAAAREVAAAAGLELRLPRTRPKPHTAGVPGRERCDWPWHGAYVSYDGFAMPCCMISTPDRLNFGRVDPGSMAGLWHGATYEDFRQRLDSGPPPDVCSACSVYHGVF